MLKIRSIILIIYFITNYSLVLSDKLISTKYTFAPVVKKAIPAVVNIFAERIVSNSHQKLFLEDNFFRHFFGDFDNKKRLEKSLGSGVIIDKIGLVITNYHVVKQTENIKIILNNGEEFGAKIILKDHLRDLVVLQIMSDRDDFPYLDLANADALEVGDIILAIGNPFGLGHTVTSGIISGLARKNPFSKRFESYIQTDAAINPGNSGGALVDLEGNLAGINTVIYSNNGTSVGIGFAIPANLLMPVIASAKKGYAKVQRPWIGLKLQTLNTAICEKLDISNDYKGAIINKIFPDSIASKENLQIGDIIIAVNDHEIKDEGMFNFRIAILTIGENVKLTILRKKEKFNINFELTPAPTMELKKITIKGRNPLAGAVVINLSPFILDEYNLSYENDGVLITEIQRGSLASMNGFVKGDIITRVNDKNIINAKELQNILRNGRLGWSMAIRRGTNESKYAFRY